MTDKKKRTTDEGYRNRNGQVNCGKTEWAGNDNNQRIYALRCGRCGFCYGANGSDVFQRKCPNCGGGESCSNPECPAKPNKGDCNECKGRKAG